MKRLMWLNAAYLVQLSLMSCVVHSFVPSFGRYKDVSCVTWHRADCGIPFRQQSIVYQTVLMKEYQQQKSSVMKRPSPKGVGSKVPDKRMRSVTDTKRYSDSNESPILRLQWASTPEAILETFVSHEAEFEGKHLAPALLRIAKSMPGEDFAVLRRHTLSDARFTQLLRETTRRLTAEGSKPDHFASTAWACGIIGHDPGAVMWADVVNGAMAAGVNGLTAQERTGIVWSADRLRREVPRPLRREYDALPFRVLPGLL